MALNDNAIACGNAALTFEELFVASIGTDSTGKATLRVIDSNDAGTNFFACQNQPIDFKTAARHLFALDSNGKIALRVSLP